MPLFVRLLVLLTVVVLAACGPSREVAEGPAEPTVEEPTDAEPVYETFDPSDYEAEPPPVETGIDHDVPAVLMDGTIEMDEGPVTVQGYRVQIFSSAEKAAADDVLDEVQSWWAVAQDDPDAAEALPDGLPAEVYFQQPYYRVRLGAFRYRREAESALPVIRRRFPDAFIVPDQVTIRG